MFKTLLLSAALASLTMTSFSAKATENDDQPIGVWSKWGRWETVFDNKGSPVYERRKRYFYMAPDGDRKSELQIHNVSGKRIAVHCNFDNDTRRESKDEWWVSLDPDQSGTNSYSFPIEWSKRWHWETDMWEEIGPGDYEVPPNTGCLPARKHLGAGLPGIWTPRADLVDAATATEVAELRGRVHPGINPIFATAIS